MKSLANFARIVGLHLAALPVIVAFILLAIGAASLQRAWRLATNGREACDDRLADIAERVRVLEEQ